MLCATFLLLPWCAAQLFSQNEDIQKIVIAKRTVSDDGSESSETIVKKGAAAQNFDVEKYLSENRSDNTYLEIKVISEDGERRIVTKGNKTLDITDENEEEEEDEEGYGGYQGYEGYEGYAGYEGYGGYNSSNANAIFLGVQQDSDEKANEPGLYVDVVRGSAADKAGLRDNDKIMSLNGTPTNRWSDLSKFVNAGKAGDQVRIVYERNGKSASTTATLTKRSDVKCDTKCEPRGFLGVSENDDDDEKPGIPVSITAGSGAYKAGLRDGDVILQLGEASIADFEDISDFMAYTKPGDKIPVIYERNGKRNTVEATLTEQKNNWNLQELEKGNCTVNVREKDACLGVYTDAVGLGEEGGSRISDFTNESAAREVNMEKGDVITSLNALRVRNHDDLWNEIAKLKIGDKVKIDFLRDGKPMSTEVTLKACQDNSSRVQVLDDAGQQLRNFLSWNWNEDDQRRLRERSIITIRKGEGDSPKVNATPNTATAGLSRSLQLSNFRAYPNPTQGQVTVEFSGEPVATTVSFFDLSGRQLFREELNAFSGQYYQQFDLTAYANGTIIIQVQQGEKIFAEQMQVN